MKNMDHKQAAQMLWEAEQGRYQIDMLTQTHPEMTVELVNIVLKVFHSGNLLFFFVVG